LYLRLKQNLAIEAPLTISISSAAAFRSAIDSREAVVTLRRASEVGAQLAAEDANTRAHIFPIANGSRIVALLFAPQEEALNFEGLELITSMASAVLERQSNQ